ncbi:RNB domain-containing ribonuclease [Microlunatus ginsengisoli]|uniref:RNB domain-containing ribonuclease n=1 Tax=Microlunatus ginsengisoli TaxID=363863 RepID=A0ABP6ZQK5_9ACTN
MPARKVAVEDVPEGMAAALAALRVRLGIPDDFPSEVLAAAAQAAPALPELDRTDLDLLTVDPEGSRDLDQALHIARHGDGYLISYAIADVAAFVPAGGPVDAEARRRGVTLYAPDRRTPLHPPALSEGAASLLPDQIRPALLWTLTVDAAGGLQATDVRRARVRSRAQLSYDQAQAEIDGGRPRETLALLAEVGPLRERQERDRGGVSLNLPEQEIRTGSGGWSLAYRSSLPVEGWNAQISLLTGMAAARLMLDAKIGIVRSVPPADGGSLRRLRSVAGGLHIRWAAEVSYPEFVRGLDASRPADAAMLDACTALFRGAGYQAFDGVVPDHPEHAALAAPYAHVTAPLRRRVDRYAGEICLALCAGAAVPDWVRSALSGLPAEMQAAERAAKAYERAIVDLMEVFVLRDRAGETFTGTVVDVDSDGRRGTVVLKDPAVEAQAVGTDLPLGREVRLRVASADVERGAVTFELV